MALAPASAPRVTYGKKRPALLPLTGEQFRRSSIFEVPTQDTEAQRKPANVDQHANHRVTTEDSQLSDAESSEEVVSTPGNDVPEAAKASVSGSMPRPTRRQSLESAGKCDARPMEVPIKPSTAKHQHASPQRPKQRRATPKRLKQHIQVPNELLLLPMQLVEDLKPSVRVETHSDSSSNLRNDPIVPHDRRADDQHEANAIKDAPAKLRVSRPRSGLTAHRRRLKSIVREYKTIQQLQGKPNTGMDEASHMMPGDGFEKSELQIAHRHRLKLRHRRQRKSEQLWQGVQQLTLCAEAADEPDFLRAPIKTEPTPGRTCALVLSADHPAGGTGSYTDEQQMFQQHVGLTLPAAGPSVMSRQQELVAIELSSLSAPVRQYSVSVCGDEDADEDEVDDGAAESYVDEVDIEACAIEEIVEVESDPAEEVVAASERPEDKLAEQRLGDPALMIYPRGSSLRERPGLVRRPSGRHLMEVNETIFDDAELDPDHDILFDDAPHSIPPVAAQMLPQPRSILKPSRTVTQVPIATGPELTARNTRRNSRMTATHSTDFSSSDPSSDPELKPMRDEESRYFASAQQQLSASPAQPRSIIRKKSNDPGVGYTFGDAMDVQVPYSGSLTVAETSPVRGRFSDESQLRILERGGDVIRHAERDLREVEQNLGRLTRR
ncbi:hypothetical protein LTR95_002594, partial [Oleoguttula sp. CCFEE 5521]